MVPRSSNLLSDNVSTFGTVFPEMGQGARSDAEFAARITLLVARMPLSLTGITLRVTRMAL